MNKTLDQIFALRMSQIRSAPIEEVYKLPQATDKVHKEALGVISQDEVAEELRRINKLGENFRMRRSVQIT